MHDALGRAGGAAAVEPEGRRVSGRRCDGGFVAVGVLCPARHGHGSIEARNSGGVATHDDCLDCRCADNDRRHGRCERFGHHDGPCARVSNDRRELGAGQHGRQGHGDNARPLRSQEPRRERDVVSDDHRHTIAVGEAECARRVLGAPQLLLQLGVGRRLTLAPDRNPIAAPVVDVAVHQPSRTVVRSAVVRRHVFPLNYLVTCRGRGCRRSRSVQPVPNGLRLVLVRAGLDRSRRRRLGVDGTGLHRSSVRRRSCRPGRR